MQAYRVYARAAAAAFFLVALYTLTVKGAGGELEGDWLHTVLHVGTGAFAVYAGWAADTAAAARALTVTVGLAYGVLGSVGWFVDGLFMDTTFRIPLGAADNVFHLALAAGAAATVAAAHRAEERPAAAADMRGRGSQTLG